MSTVLRNQAVAGGPRGAAAWQGGAQVTAGRGRKDDSRKKLRHPQDPREELLPAAEFLGDATDFGPALESFVDSPFNPENRHKLGRLTGMFAMDYQGGRGAERAYLRQVLDSQNAKEAYASHVALHLLKIPPTLRRTLTLAVAYSGVPGQRHGCLRAVEARLAATCLQALGPAGRRVMADVWMQAAGLERALILKALVARRSLMGPWSPKDGTKALTAITTFADHIRGLPQAKLVVATSLATAHAQAVMKGPLDASERAWWMAMGETDPVFSLSQYQEHVEVLPQKTPGVRPTQEDKGNVFGFESDLHLQRIRLHQALSEARGHEERLPNECSLALTDYCAGSELGPKRVDAKNRALEILRERAFDVVEANAVERMRDEAKTKHVFDAGHALGIMLSRFSGATYVQRVNSDQRTAGVNPALQIQEALQRGYPVPWVVRDMHSNARKAYLFEDHDQVTLKELSTVRDAVEKDRMTVPWSDFLLPELPRVFGSKKRFDLYLAPVGLDLFAPPFGIVFMEMGIEDRLG